MSVKKNAATRKPAERELDDNWWNEFTWDYQYINSGQMGFIGKKPGQEKVSVSLTRKMLDRYGQKSEYKITVKCYADANGVIDKEDAQIAERTVKEILGKSKWTVSVQRPVGYDYNHMGHSATYMNPRSQFVGDELWSMVIDLHEKIMPTRRNAATRKPAERKDDDDTWWERYNWNYHAQDQYGIEQLIGDAGDEVMVWIAKHENQQGPTHQIRFQITVKSFDAKEDENAKRLAGEIERTSMWKITQERPVGWFGRDYSAIYLEPRLGAYPSSGSKLWSMVIDLHEKIMPARRNAATRMPAELIDPGCDHEQWTGDAGDEVKVTCDKCKVEGDVYVPYDWDDVDDEIDWYDTRRNPVEMISGHPLDVTKNTFTTIYRKSSIFDKDKNGKRILRYPKNMQKAAETITGQVGAKIRAGLRKGVWMIQAVLIPRKVGLSKENAVKLADKVVKKFEPSSSPSAMRNNPKKVNPAPLDIVRNAATRKPADADIKAPWISKIDEMVNKIPAAARADRRGRPRELFWDIKNWEPRWDGEDVSENVKEAYLWGEDSPMPYIIVRWQVDDLVVAGHDWDRYYSKRYGWDFGKLLYKEDMLSYIPAYPLQLKKRNKIDGEAYKIDSLSNEEVIAGINQVGGNIPLSKYQETRRNAMTRKPAERKVGKWWEEADWNWTHDDAHSYYPPGHKNRKLNEKQLEATIVVPCQPVVDDKRAHLWDGEGPCSVVVRAEAVERRSGYGDGKPMRRHEIKISAYSFEPNHNGPASDTQTSGNRARLPELKAWLIEHGFERGKLPWRPGAFEWLPKETPLELIAYLESLYMSEYPEWSFDEYVRNNPTRNAVTRKPAELAEPEWWEKGINYRKAEELQDPDVDIEFDVCIRAELNHDIIPDFIPPRNLAKGSMNYFGVKFDKWKWNNGSRVEYKYRWSILAGDWLSNSPQFRKWLETLMPHRRTLQGPSLLQDSKPPMTQKEYHDAMSRTETVYAYEIYQNSLEDGTAQEDKMIFEYAESQLGYATRRNAITRMPAQITGHSEWWEDFDWDFNRQGDDVLEGSRRRRYIEKEDRYVYDSPISSVFIYLNKTWGGDVPNSDGDFSIQFWGNYEGPVYVLQWTDQWEVIIDHDGNNDDDPYWKDQHYVEFKAKIEEIKTTISQLDPERIRNEIRKNKDMVQHPRRNAITRNPPVKYTLEEATAKFESYLPLGWILSPEGNAIAMELTFQSPEASADFVAKVWDIAKDAKHYPTVEWDMFPAVVRLICFSWSAGGLTEHEVDLVDEISTMIAVHGTRLIEAPENDGWDENWEFGDEYVRNAATRKPGHLEDDKLFSKSNILSVRLTTSKKTLFAKVQWEGLVLDVKAHTAAAQSATRLKVLGFIAKSEETTTLFNLNQATEIIQQLNNDYNTPLKDINFIWPNYQVPGYILPNGNIAINASWIHSERFTPEMILGFIETTEDGYYDNTLKKYIDGPSATTLINELMKAL